MHETKVENVDEAFISLSYCEYDSLKAMGAMAWRVRDLTEGYPVGQECEGQSCLFYRSSCSDRSLWGDIVGLCGLMCDVRRQSL
jgi:hypothetical protein